MDCCHINHNGRSHKPFLQRHKKVCGFRVAKPREIDNQSKTMRTAALIVAAGTGVRASADGDPMPKQYRSLAGRSVLSHAIAAFSTHPDVDAVRAVIHRDHQRLYEAASGGMSGLLPPVTGGKDRMASVRLGLESLAGDPPDLVLIHDAARPFVSAGTIARTIASADIHGGALPVVPVRDTVKRIDAGGRVAETLDRDTLRLAQTPQTFRFEAILRAHRRAAETGLVFTDDAAVAEWAGLAVVCVEGDDINRKLTMPSDFDTAGHRMTTRCGLGYDVHALAAGDHVVLGGVAIPHDRRLSGHSDADVVLHALTDAILGALAEGDIGTHFPPGDPQWKGAASETFVRFAAGRVAARGGVIDHLDVMLMCEAPRIGPHRETMRARIATMADVTPARVSIKATTNEGIGFVGRGEGIAAQAVASIRLPEASS